MFYSFPPSLSFFLSKNAVEKVQERRRRRRDSDGNDHSSSVVREREGIVVFLLLVWSAESKKT